MKDKIFFIAFTLSCSSLTIFGQNIRVEKLDKKEISKGIKYNGNIREAVRYTDRSGDYIVLISETGIYRNEKIEHENDGGDAELYSYCFAVKQNSFEQVWKVYDFIHDCPVDIVASFVKDTFQVTDLNNDGIAEVWLMYRTVCHGDVSPCNMKIIMYQGRQKFAMRGENKDQTGYGGTYRFDSAFMNGRKEFREFAKKLWNKHIEWEQTEY